MPPLNRMTDILMLPLASLGQRIVILGPSNSGKSTLAQALSEKLDHQTIVVCSHNLGELERLCDWVMMMDAGECVRQGTLEEVTNRGSVVLWSIGGAEAPLEALGRACPGHGFEVDDGVLIQRAPVGADLDTSAIAIAGVLVEARVPIRELRRGVSLEERFFDDAQDS